MAIDDSTDDELSPLQRQIERKLDDLLRKGDLSKEVIQDFIAKGLSADKVMWWAIWNKRTETVCTLIDCGADVNGSEDSPTLPLVAACNRGNLELVNILLDRGADTMNVPDFFGHTMLHWATEFCPDARIVERLLNTTAKTLINQQNDAGETPLFHLAENTFRSFTDDEKANRLRTLDLLLAAGANPSILSKKGDSLLTICVKMYPNFPEMIERLIALCPIDHANNKGKTALTIAYENFDAAKIHLLLEHGANMPQQQLDGWVHHLVSDTQTRLYIRPEYRTQSKLGMLALAVQWGAPFDKPDAAGITPLAHCLKKNDTPELVEALLNLGARIPKGIALPDAVQSRHKDATARWEALMATAPPDLASLTPPDLIGFATIGRLKDLLRPRYWHDRPAQITDLLSQLPPTLVRQAMIDRPDMAHFLATTPSSQIASGEHEGMQQPTPEAPHRAV